MSSARSTGSITEGGLTRPMFRLAWPIVVVELLQVMYNIADTFWLGRLSSDAVGALSLAFPLIFLLISVAGGFTAAGSILVAQYTGADSEGSAGAVAGQVMMFVTLMSVVLGVLGYFATDPMLALLPSRGETTTQLVPLASDYMRVFFLGMPFLFGFFTFMSLLRGYGNTRTPMRVMVVSVAFNVVLDPLLIFGWGPFPAMGIEGAAVATVTARAVATVIGFYVLFGTDAGPDVELTHLVPDLDIIEKVVRLGVPSSLEQSMSALAMITLTAMVVQFAPPVVSAYGLGNRLASLVFLPAMGLGRATNTMVGQNLGAGKSDRAERAVWLATKVGASVMLAVAVVAALFAEPIVSVFMATGTDAARKTVEHGATYLRIRSVEFGFMAVLQVMLGAYRGAGNTRTALGFSMVALWLGRVPTVYYLSFVGGMGATGLWVGMTFGNVLGATAAALWFTRGTWKKAVVDEGKAGVAPEADVDHDAGASADGDAVAPADVAAETDVTSDGGRDR
ncbi:MULTISPECIES: MATE family efflux transporter [Halorussus]|uniref:MATE family efflux transporter n=1 Tax=Halorussus TaxID=1070314 RepID=UPI00209E013C|nr:MATE family efflux transporter [Halorussus vallis]USZ74583.1 MATE family efflux transporter [Halorussus vallis]